MREYKTNMDRPDITPEEIAQNMDFSKVLDHYTTLTKPVYLKTWFLSTAALVLFGSVLVLTNVLVEEVEPAPENGTGIEQSYVFEPTEPDLMELTPFVNPPMDGINVPYESFAVKADRKSKLKYSSSGSKIKIPENAFMDKDGNDIQGDVELKYREFHDAVDIFVSGIPMNYDSAGVEYQFESAGMMEILAFQDGEPVFIKPGKEIKIEMVSNYEGEHFNLYELDPANENWTYRGKDKVTPIEGFDERPLAAVASGNNHDELVTEKPETYVSDGHGSTTSTKVHTKEVEELAKLERNVKVAKHNIVKHKKTEPVKPKTIDKTKHNFDIDYDIEEFPEMAIYQNAQFEIGDENNNFTSKMYDVQWEDIKLVEKVPGVSYDITLTKGRTKYTWVVYPVFEGADLVKAMEDFNMKYQLYKKKLKTRKEEEKVASEIYQTKKAEYEAKRQERLKKWEEQQRQYAEAQKIRERQYTTQQKVTRAFAITRFGTWNCDSPVPHPRGRNLSASFSDQDGNSLHFFSVYLVQTKRNSMFTYSAMMLEDFKYNPLQRNVIWAITSDNKLAIFTAERFKEVSGKAYTFKMEVLDQEFSTVDEVKEALNM